jgi:hypothetical protein
MSAAKREQMAGGWRKLHNEELYYLTRYKIFTEISK